MKTRVLLTGASGFVGSHVLEHIMVKTDWHVVCIAGWTHKGTPERILESDYYDSSRVDVITHDLVAPLTEQTIKSLGKIDYILNIASDSHVDRSITEPVRCIMNNVQLICTMLELARVLKPKKFLQFSTDEVYGVAPEGVNHKEWSRIIPSNPYSSSKAAQEAIACSYWRTYGVPLIITNTMNIFGERQDSEKFVAMLIKRLNAGEMVTVHGSKDFVGSRYYLHARNAADAVLYIINNIEPDMYDDGDHTVPQRFNVVGDIEMNNLDMANKVAELMGKELKYELSDFHAQRPGHDRRYALDGAKLKEAGWTAPLTFEQSLKNTIKWTLANPQWL